MKAVMILYNQSHSSSVQEILDRYNVRGFTKWVDVQGRGSYKGEPHYGSHAWPSQNMAVLAVVEESQLEGLQEGLKSVDDEAPDVGLRAFIWEADSLV